MILSVHVTLSSTNHNKYNTILMVVAIFASDCSLTFALLAWLAMTTAAAITTVKRSLILSGCQPWLSALVVSPDCQSGRPVQTLGMSPSYIPCGTPGVPLRTSRGSGGRVCRISECVHHSSENGTPAPTVDLMLDQRRRRWTNIKSTVVNCIAWRSCRSPPMFAHHTW